MRRFTRNICFALVMVLLLSVAAFAAEVIEPKASNFFGKSSVYIANVSGTYFEPWFDVTGTGIMDKIGAKTIKVQRSSDGVNWTTMRTWTMDDYPSLIDTNTATHGAGVSYTGSRGYYYRAYIELYAKNSTGNRWMPICSS